MKVRICLTLLTAALALVVAAPGRGAVPPRLEELEAEAAAVADEFARRLGGALRGALQEGGPSSALGVCQQRAPEIAASLGRERGWQVRRVSHRTRNPENTTDVWEGAVLEHWLQGQRSGEPIAPLHHGELVTDAGGSRYRYMRAIPMAGLCLNCHGEKLDPALQDQLRQRYPQDRAIGFKLGELRGAFSLQKLLP